MIKRLKSIMAVMMAVAMLMSICCVPTMAAEQISEVSKTEADQQSQVNTGNASGSATYNGSTVKVTTMWIQGSASLLKHKITGPANTWINIRLVHSSGDTRSFTGISNGQWLSDTYYTPMRSGYWDVYIIGAGAQGTYNVQINAYFTGETS